MCTQKCFQRFHFLLRLMTLVFIKKNPDYSFASEWSYRIIITDTNTFLILVIMWEGADSWQQRECQRDKRRQEEQKKAAGDDEDGRSNAVELRQAESLLQHLVSVSADTWKTYRMRGCCFVPEQDLFHHHHLTERSYHVGTTASRCAGTQCYICLQKLWRKCQLKASTL